MFSKFKMLLILLYLTTTALAFSKTEYRPCYELWQANKVSDNSNLYWTVSTTDTWHWALSSNQWATCVYYPATPEDIATGMKLIAKHRSSFGVSCSGHAMNQGFSSTTGIHITMARFQDVIISPDRSYVDIGGGISWADVYSKLEGTGLSVVGGRVPGPGIGGFVTGGGGYSWKTNRYGLTSDTLMSVEMILPNGTQVTASESINPDLFWAIKGGGNRFGIIYSFRLQTVPQSPTVYGGYRMLSHNEVPAMLNATHNFALNNKDLKAQILPTVNTIAASPDHIAGEPGGILIALYDGDPGDTNPFQSFGIDFTKQSFSSFVNSIPSKWESGHRGSFHTVMFKNLSIPVLEQIKNQTRFWSKDMLLHSGWLVSLEIEAFSSYAKFSKDAAWPHNSDGLPLNIYYAWTLPEHDDYWHDALKQTARMLSETAKADGQDLSTLNLYPNYALADTDPILMYTPVNLAKLKQLRQRYDPDNVMLLTTYFEF